MLKITISNDTYLDAHNLSQGVFAPLTGFMNQFDYASVVDCMRLDDGTIWPLPITLEVERKDVCSIMRADEALIVLESGEKVGAMQVHDPFEINPKEDCKKIFGTSDPAHPGVAYELSRSRYRVGGEVKLFENYSRGFPGCNYTPTETKSDFAKLGWKTIAGFQTRNPPHTAHESLLRTALELSDGIFIQPLIGWKKEGDFTPESITGAYKIMREKFLPKKRTLFGWLRTAMRYAGPREAVFHALIRKNYGCTSFIIGRDHAGVDGYYGKYAAQDLARSFGKELGIDILSFEALQNISGTAIRKTLSEGKRPEKHLMRPEISDYLLSLHKQDKLFIKTGEMKMSAFTIIITVGPQLISNFNTLKEMHNCGSCIFRINGAHCAPEDISFYAEHIRMAIPDAKIMIDLPGNKIRTASLPEPIKFTKGEKLILFGEQFNFQDFPKYVKSGDIILANDSQYSFEVLKTSIGAISVMPHHTGELISNKGVNVAGITQSLPFMLDKDKELLKAAAKEDLEYVSLSYVRDAKDVQEAKNTLCALNYLPKLIAKIETGSAVFNIPSILQEVDIINVDRGDLSTEVGLLKLGGYQQYIIDAALSQNKDIFLATQFLKNMETHPIPLIPEILDMQNSILNDISGIQLSEETAIGKYPLECVKLIWDVVKHTKRGANK